MSNTEIMLPPIEPDIPLFPVLFQAASDKLSTTNNGLYHHLAKHATQFYSRNQGAVIERLVSMHKLPTTSALAKLIKFPIILEKLNRLFVLVEFFPDWQTDWTMVLDTLVPVRSMVVSQHFQTSFDVHLIGRQATVALLDIIITNLSLIKGACLASDDFRDSFTCRRTTTLVPKELKKKYKVAILSNSVWALEDVESIFDQKAIKILTEVLKCRSTGLDDLNSVVRPRLRWRVNYLNAQPIPVLHPQFHRKK